MQFGSSFVRDSFGFSSGEPPFYKENPEENPKESPRKEGGIFPLFFHISPSALPGCFLKAPIFKNFPRTILEQNWEKTTLKMPRSDKSGQMRTNGDK